jgi:hypothetical protein
MAIFKDSSKLSMRKQWQTQQKPCLNDFKDNSNVTTNVGFVVALM